MIILFYIMPSRTPRSTLFPYTTLFRSYLNQPDGEAVYSWGYGCNGTPAGFAPTLNGQTRSEEHTSELQSLTNLVCRLLLVKKNFSILSVLAFMVCWVSSPE